MFILDSLFMSGFRWVLDTVVTAADAEMNDDSALREELLAAEMRREMGEISDDEYAGIEKDLLARIREIKERREGGSGPIAIGEPLDTSGTQLSVEASVSGDFHDTGSRVIEGTVVASETVDADTSRARTKRTSGTPGTKRTGTTRTARTARTPRTSKPPRTS